MKSAVTDVAKVLWNSIGITIRGTKYRWVGKMVVFRAVDSVLDWGAVLLKICVHAHRDARVSWWSDTSFHHHIFMILCSAMCANLHLWHIDHDTSMHSPSEAVELLNTSMCTNLQAAKYTVAVGESVPNARMWFFVIAKFLVEYCGANINPWKIPRSRSSTKFITLLLVPSIPCQKFHENSFRNFQVMLVRDRQTDRQTDRQKTWLVSGSYIGKSCRI